MTEFENLWQCERGFWLEGKPHYACFLARDARMVFPDPAGFLDADQIVRGLEGVPRWESVAFEAQHATGLNDTIVLCYRATGLRTGSNPYRVLCSSTYVLDGEIWKLLMHHHTPCD